MLIIELSGGLGNQMFQYALYLEMKKLNKDVYLDSSLFSTGKNAGDGAPGSRLELERAFGISFMEASAKNPGKDPLAAPCKEGAVLVSRKTASDIRGYATDDTVFDKIRHRITKPGISVYRDVIDRLQPEIFKMDDVFLSGYWQSEKYFTGAVSEVREAFSFANIKEENILLAEQMRSENSVSLHVRRGDYMKPENSRIYGGICTADYYNAAVRYIKEHVDSPRIYVFTDDTEWVRSNMPMDKVTIVDANRGPDSYQDMFLMSSCRHHIIANSSFSWWGAWLGNAVCGADRPEEKGLVLCPDRWFNNHSVREMFCDDWINIGL